MPSRLDDVYPPYCSALAGPDWNIAQDFVPFFLPTIWAVNDPRGVPTLVLVPTPHQPLADPPWCCWCNCGGALLMVHTQQVLVHCMVCTQLVLVRAPSRCTSSGAVFCARTPLPALWPGNWSAVFGCGILPFFVALDPLYNLGKRNNSIHSTYIQMMGLKNVTCIAWDRKDPGGTDWVAWMNAS